MPIEKRSSKRFGIHLPVQIEVLGGKRVARSAQTSNIGSGGVSFASAREAKLGGKIEFLITLADGQTPVRIRCVGKVLRIEPLADNAETPWQVTATIDRYKFVRPEKAEAKSAPPPRAAGPNANGRVSIH